MKADDAVWARVGISIGQTNAWDAKFTWISPLDAGIRAGLSPTHTAPGAPEGRILALAPCTETLHKSH